MTITLERQDAVAVVTIDRPEKLNSLTLAMYRQLGEALIEVHADPAIAVAVLTGRGERAFCVGADLTESIPALAEGRFDISEWDDAHQKHVRQRKPVIAAVNGLCLGGGFEIMLSTDIRIASATAEFGLPEVGIGVVPAGGTLVRLTRQIPYAWAMQLMLGGDRVGAETALRFGLLNDVVAPDALLDTAMTWAARLARNSGTAMAVVKEAVQYLSDLPSDQAFRYEALLGQKAFTSADAREGMAAFYAGRRPNFPSRTPAGPGSS
ncbi:enoyl-CoA hydratase/isomerase family protein [Phytohabitans sp. ZYX-F-186]|uniref:Enoyl-CoA hydratase/isomerase family protein n=1 Tax=Phytohabitans maris TaxID=3071409 RepID=A0ABU0ZSI1_9ACTN|nr:enoyl-CoA hydratase/isomerase family protein [Phytohabitans sp. ZYX-F-186]MDQ7909990.1 enoyl-CoA hydratase/isomerase family protein [Phytohabitans sp. ZYX-F-186]